MGKEIYLEHAIPSVEQSLIAYSELGGKFENPPQIELKLSSQTVGDLPEVDARSVAITSAVQCYSPGLAIVKPRTKDYEQNIADSTLQAGHHTTRMHTHYTWRIKGASRLVTHNPFHAHPFYNSEQQSQRYVEAKRGSYLVPADLTDAQREKYLDAADFSNEAYFQLLKLLHPEVEQRMMDMYPESGWRVKSTKERLDKKSEKIGQEIARYVLPLAQKTNYFHTLSHLQLLRMYRASQSRDFSDEARYIIGQMLKSVAQEDPLFMREVENPLVNETIIEPNENYITNQKVEFDEILGERSSALVGDNESSRGILSMALRNVTGLSSDELSESDVLKAVLDPSRNSLIADVYDTGMLDQVTSTLRQVNFTFLTKMSHTGDSQRQRHRRTPGATPSVASTYDGHPDYVTPLVIRENSTLSQHYDQTMETIYDNVAGLIESGVSKEYALALLPNAHAIRVVESGDLFDWMHRWKQRLCYLAQEEIFFVSVDQVAQLGEVIPEVKGSLLAPCGIRKAAGIKPRCPEGDKFCGKPVFNWDIDKYVDERLI